MRSLEEEGGDSRAAMLQPGVSLLPVISYHGEDSSALTILLLQLIVVKILRLFFTREVSKIPVTSAPCEPSLKLCVPCVFLRLADGRQAKTLKRGEITFGMCFYSNGTARSKVTACSPL